MVYIKFEPKEDITFDELVQIVKLITEMPLPSTKIIFENFPSEVTRHLRVVGKEGK
jgi:hypothetical protein